MAKRKIWIERRSDGHFLHFNEPHPYRDDFWRSKPSYEFGAGQFGQYVCRRFVDGLNVNLEEGQVQEIEYELTTVWERA